MFVNHDRMNGQTGAINDGNSGSAFKSRVGAQWVLFEAHN
jgi:hypothetical protein